MNTIQQNLKEAFPIGEVVSIDATRIFKINSSEIKVGELVLLKPSRITGFGRTCRVIHESKNFLSLEVINIWFPHFIDTPFGEINKLKQFNGQNDKDLINFKNGCIGKVFKINKATNCGTSINKDLSLATFI
ncbi:hypothetical protein BPT24_085 [Tenacibaculum phage pT24]|uniref:Uncharacterized protein n=1 Tax=Tenacibaculum phage pT24 TaxID=1880590 RepID=A0A1B4XWL5_9CAUD|nr:hypothetical protein HYP10_gp085 [Tenacibaculum phage pT24]BAV39210.1 hypothetical protein BPT24_085 [Tenacibaculum phage pT24]